MKTIHKYGLDLNERQTLKLPTDAQILTIQKQGDGIFVWVKLDTDHRTTNRVILTVGTGQAIIDIGMHYIDTVQIHGMVWHFFEL